MLYASRRGSGPPVVLVHGFTQTGASWMPIADRLVSAGHEVIAVDAPGHGQSAGYEADLNSGAELLAAATADAGRAGFVGYSMGARLCLHVALRYPKLVERLVLVGATGGIDDADERAARRHADEILAGELEQIGVPAFLDRWLSQPLFATLSAEASGRPTRLANTVAGLASSLRLAGTGTQQPLWDRLASLAMPVLVVAGELDPKFTEAGHRLVDCIGANARFESIAGAGHAVPAERPDAFVEVVLRFLAG